MQGLQIFNHNIFGNIEVISLEDKVLFPATDVARVLGYVNTTKAIKDHCRWVTKREVPHPQSNIKVIEKNFIPEGDLYRLITRSKLPSALDFEKWVFDEILPTIRKTGKYAVETKTELTTLDVLKIASAEIEKLSARNEQLTEVLVAFQKGEDSWLIRQFVKYVYDERGITIGEQQMHDYIRKDFLDNFGLPFARFKQYFAVKRNYANGRERKPTIKLTQRGVNYFTNRLLKENKEGVTCHTADNH